MVKYNVKNIAKYSLLRFFSGLASAENAGAPIITKAGILLSQ
jgi:hypothetical protein